VELLVCSRCRTGADEEGAERPGAVLARRLQEVCPQDVALRLVECLSNCSQGCTIALRGPGRWTYVYGRFEAEGDLGQIIEGVRKYAATPDGLVPWRERPDHFRKNCIARVPPVEGY
jgi:predicted metal-binding protein